VQFWVSVSQAGLASGEQLANTTRKLPRHVLWTYRSARSQEIALWRQLYFRVYCHFRTVPRCVTSSSYECELLEASQVWPVVLVCKVCVTVVTGGEAPWSCRGVVYTLFKKATKKTAPKSPETYTLALAAAKTVVGAVKSGTMRCLRTTIDSQSSLQCKTMVAAGKARASPQISSKRRNCTQVSKHSLVSNAPPCATPSELQPVLAAF
jgi:hypothetical protein